MGNLIPRQPDRFGTIAIPKLDRSDLYNDTAAFNPADLTLRLSCQVRRFEQKRIQPEHSALIGEVIPSRWAFEALVTEQFRNNSYNRLFFTVEKEKFLAQYYRNVHADEVRSLINSLNRIPEKREKNTRTIHNELAVLSVPPVSPPIRPKRVTRAIWIK